MRKILFGLALLALTWSSTAAEKKFDLKDVVEGQLPSGFRSILTGEGKPGQWQVILDAAPSQFQSLTPNAATYSKRPVIAQLAQESTDEHFPVLIYDEESYNDFTLTTKFKIVAGTAEQMAGVAFRIQDEKNYYVIRASALGNNLRFYKFVDGKRSLPIGPATPISTNVWHELKVQCTGNQITCWLNGQALIPPLADNSFMSGKIGLWTKSDSVSYFADTQLTYTPKEPLAQKVARDVLEQYSRLLDLKIFAPKRSGDVSTMVAIAAKHPADLGQPAEEVHRNVFNRESIFYGKGRDSVSVVMPLRDRNGEILGAVEFDMETFFGQTEQNAIGRATPILKAIHARIQTASDLM